MGITYALLEDVAHELNRRAAIAVPLDAKEAFVLAAQKERNATAKLALEAVVRNADVAVAEQSAMCGDTGLPRFYVKAGNGAQIDGGFFALERALRRGTALATRSVPLRSNRVHPLTRRNPNNNVGVLAPNVDYRFEPEGDWIELTAVHKGGLFGSDYRMLFPGDGIPGIKRFFVDTLVAFGHRGLSCPPVIVGVGLGGTKDQCVTLGKEAACLRLVGDRHPDPLVADLEDELYELGNKTMLGIMGFKSDTPVLDVHCEIAYAHTGGLPVGISELCHAVRRATARVYNDGRVEYRQDPQWFTPYMRNEDVDWDPERTPYYARPDAGRVTVKTGVNGTTRRVIPLVELSDAALTPALSQGEREQGPGTNGSAAPARESRTFHLTVPLTDADVRQLRVGDVVYLNGCIFTARDGVYEHMLQQGHEPPIDIRNEYNVTTQSSPAGAEVAPGKYEVTSLQATAGFRYAQWMEPLFARYGVKAVINKGGMSVEMYRDVFKKHGVVCLSMMPYGIGAIYGKEVVNVRDVIWKQELGMSEAMWLLEVEELGPLLVEGDAEGNSYNAVIADEVNAPLRDIYKDLPELILKRFGEVRDPAQEMIG
ncbi:MAG: Fumarate hydratase class I, alpha region; L(+)-tartrate dehydratase alpha subunit [uncultured Chloroflexi bacterium]|uniref:Fumarate hydratase class I, alpha region L(+)-tartrate dehydratase alpha subunit n=1 Tax=uncultured Chloroflexota bacterium TaxID=166587 RepID=A0A6J4H111_9CHLR|nr:MAG: Fumarate hydratase class I, alpha region; L(+)-tartrate dehydratase alpha subunit [uncultured Chloroflexota bacterium]